MFQDELRDVVVYYHEYVDFNYSMLQKHEGYGIVIVDVTNHEYVDYDVMNHVFLYSQFHYDVFHGYQFMHEGSYDYEFYNLRDAIVNDTEMLQLLLIFASQ
eukprot:TRINITY_DN6692_c0_g1_i1.p2 TRINITY_DN6692_c0_g1~~TRINITY_DN6692_c0_g1_i1.p2  ORF type:complete len:101 (+),score=0.76 TRINITY_DN6692_c0_g1_i1:378-680(+)